MAQQDHGPGLKKFTVRCHMSLIVTNAMASTYPETRRRVVRTGVVGCGVISGIYFENLLKFGAVDVVACSDLKPELSEAVADANPGIQAMTTDELLALEGWRSLAWKAQACSVPGWRVSSPVMDTRSSRSTARTGSLAAGLAERFIRTLHEKWAYSLPFTSNRARFRALPRFLRYYNYHRLHGGIGGAVPTSKL